MERLTEVITDVFGETRVVLSEPSKNSICNGCLFQVNVIAVAYTRRLKS